ncbi:helix-turn-helix transcriptional regulator [Blautia sp. HCP3S3_D9]|uniref:helix-turn-helix transcriptional regulator n=1 Tax=unclassified Blautia TaxID=2648079 RepID=UPI002A802EC3|nr:helix-turn-helix transcriptional regulator [Blautia sp.]MDY4115126.1 helix-turn-helix transcriptional regulator [Blautia sp.]
MKMDKIKFICELARRNMSIKQVAEKSGVTRNTISAIKNGKSCTPATAGRIAKALELDVTDIFTVN